MTEMTFESAREQFVALREKTFLDAACVSLTPKVAVDAIRSFLEGAQQCRARSATANHIIMDQLRAGARPRAAQLIGATEDEIALVESTSHGLALAADAIPLERGDRVLVCDLEFMQVAIPWCQLRERIGIEIDRVPHREGRIVVEDIGSRIQAKTRVLCISSVQWSNGFRCDLAAISKLCREAGVWLVVDAVQQLGAFPIDVSKTQVDVLTCGGHKWLNAPFGAGFLYLRREAMARLRAPLAGYLSLETPDGGWGSYFQTPSIVPVRDYAFTKSARRFEVGGTANYPGAVGLAASLGLVLELGQERIAAHITALTDRLIAGLHDAHIDVVTPVEHAHRSGIVTFSVGSAAENIALMDKLLERDVLVSVRYTANVGGVRVSSHLYNSEEDIDRLLEALPRAARGT